MGHYTLARGEGTQVPYQKIQRLLPPLVRVSGAGRKPGLGGQARQAVKPPTGSSLERG